MDEHLDSAEEQAGGVGEVLAGAARSRTVDGFEHGASIADIGAAGESDRSCDLGSDVREDIAVEVRHDDHVEGFWGIGEFCGTDIDNPMFVFDVFVFGGDFIEDFMKQPVGQFHDIVFGKAGDFFATVGTSVLEGVADDFFGSWSGDEFQALHHVEGLAVFDARIEIFFVFANDDHVHFWVFGPNERIVAQAWTDVGIQAEGFSGRHVEGLEPTPLGCGDRCFEEHSGGSEVFKSAGFDPCHVPFEVLLFPDLDDVFFEPCASLFDDVKSGFHDFGADTVTVGDCDGGC